jgi:hypothetical protein
MAGRAQQKKHKRSGLLVDGDEMAAARQQQQKEVWLLQSQLAEGLLAGLAEEDVFEAQALLASVHQNRYQAEAEAQQLSALAELHLRQKTKHRSGLISLSGGGGKKSKDEIKKKKKEARRAEEALEKMKRQAGEEKAEQEKRTRQLEALRQWQLKSGPSVLRDV